jgi:hypothetical protein
MVLKPGDFPISEGIYDVLKDKWVSGPVKIPEDFDPDEAFAAQKDYAEKVAMKIDLVIGAIVRTVDYLKKIDQYRKHYGGITAQKVAYMARLQHMCKALDAWHNWVNALPEASKNLTRAHYPAFNYSSNWEAKTVIFKYLARSGYHRPIRMLFQLLDNDDPYRGVINRFIPD